MPPYHGHFIVIGDDVKSQPRLNFTSNARTPARVHPP